MKPVKLGVNNKGFESKIRETHALFIVSIESFLFTEVTTIAILVEYIKGRREDTKHLFVFFLVKNT